MYSSRPDRSRPMNHPCRRGALALMSAAAAFLASCSELAFAQQFPSRSIRMLVGFAPGGPADVPGRAVAAKLAELTGVPVVVENKVGAASMLAMQDMLSQPRDGHTLLVCTYNDPANTVFYRKARYQLSDIAPVSLIGTWDFAVAVANAVPARTIGELALLAKAEPNRFNYGHIGTGSPANLVFKQLEKLTGMRMTAINFRGSAPAIQEMIANRLDLFVVPPISAVEQHEAGQLKVLAVTGKARLAALPNVPTLQEAGVPLVFFAFLGICAGGGTPEPVIQRLNRLIGDIVAMPDYQQLMAKLGSAAVASTSSEMQSVLDTVVRDAKPVIEEFNLFAD